LWLEAKTLPAKATVKEQRVRNPERVIRAHVDVKPITPCLARKVIVEEVPILPSLRKRKTLTTHQAKAVGLMLPRNMSNYLVLETGATATDGG
tara:strand:- start:63 stop:341 length:279 start_codon:yes stop_codon:yes gene_type:complete